MSDKIKSRLEVQKILRAAILQGIQHTGCGDNWNVIEYGQPLFQNCNKVVTMNLLRYKNIGWQAQKYTSPNETTLTRTDHWLEEQHWQLQVILKRTNTETESSLIAEDIAVRLVSWFNGAGNEKLRESGIANTRIDAENIMSYNDDNSLYQRRSVFTVKIEVPKELSVGQSWTGILEPETHPI